MKIISVTIALILVIAQAKYTCDPPLTIIPATFLDNLFDKAFQNTRPVNALNEIILNPDLGTFKNYAISFAPSIIPILAFGVISFILFFVGLFQLICYNCCRIE